MRSTNLLTYLLTYTISPFDEKSFNAAGLRLWNNLPSYLTEDIS